MRRDRALELAYRGYEAHIVLHVGAKPRQHVVAHMREHQLARTDAWQMAFQRGEV